MFYVSQFISVYCTKTATQFSQIYVEAKNKIHIRKTYTSHEVEVQFALVYYAITLINMLKSTTVEEAVRKRMS